MERITENQVSRVSTKISRSKDSLNVLEQMLLDLGNQQLGYSLEICDLQDEELSEIESQKLLTLARAQRYVSEALEAIRKAEKEIDALAISVTDTEE